MHLVWKSSLSRQLKIRFFRATVESVLLYGSETWTLTKALKKRLDGTYTRLLRTALNVSWEDHVTNSDLYQELLPVTEVIKERHLRFVAEQIDVFLHVTMFVFFRVSFVLLTV